jgi:hypothetical protein
MSGSSSRRVQDVPVPHRSRPLAITRKPKLTVEPIDEETRAKIAVLVASLDPVRLTEPRPRRKLKPLPTTTLRFAIDDAPRPLTGAGLDGFPVWRLTSNAIRLVEPAAAAADAPPMDDRPRRGRRSAGRPRRSSRPGSTVRGE